MKKYLPIIVSLVLLTIVIAFTCFYLVKAKIVLNAPSVCEVGELVTLDATLSDANSFQWKIIPTTPNFAIIEDGKRAFFSSPNPGSYLCVIAAAKNNEVDCLVHELIVKNDDFIIKNDDFTILIKSWLPPEADPVILQSLSRSFKESANAKDIETLIKTTAIANRAVLGNNLDTYKPFLVSFSKYLSENYQDKSLEEHRQLWLKIAETLISC